MLWITRRSIRVNRAATGWLVRRFVDPCARFRFVDPGEVASVERGDRAIGFDALGVRYPHKDGRGRCSFEALVEEYRPADAALREMARIVHHADFPEEASRPRRPKIRLEAFDVISLLGPGGHSATSSPTPEAAGLRAIAAGFSLASYDDHETLERSGFLYEALYASLCQRLGG